MDSSHPFYAQLKQGVQCVHKASHARDNKEREAGRQQKTRKEANKQKMGCMGCMGCRLASGQASKASKRESKQASEAKFQNKEAGKQTKRGCRL